MPALERRPTEPRGRTVFLQVRDIAQQRTADVVRELPRRGDPHDGEDEDRDTAPQLTVGCEALPSEEPQPQAARRIRFYRGNTLMVGAKAGST